MRTAMVMCLSGILMSCAHGSGGSASRKYAQAPRIENPLSGNAQVGVGGMTETPDAMAFTAFDGHHLCFEGGNRLSPGEASSSSYSLKFLDTDEVDLKHAATLLGVVRIINSQSQLVPVTRTVQDTVRDARGNKVGSVDRQVQELETHYQTQVQVCFPEPQQALTMQSRFMVLLKEGAARTWGIAMGPRPSWVWRLPAADNAAEHE